MLERPVDFRNRFSDEDRKLMVKEGLYYTANGKMDDLFDQECRRPSRCYIVKMLINFGANPNHLSTEVLMTPLHWLAFWGDHRAVRIMVKLNREDLINPKGCCPDTREQFIRKRGALNAFLTQKMQTPADIAGDMYHNQCLKHFVEHFYFNMEN